MAEIHGGPLDLCHILPYKKYAVWPYPKTVFAPALGHFVNGVPSLLPERIVQLSKWQKSWQNLDGSYYKSVGSIRAPVRSFLGQVCQSVMASIITEARTSMYALPTLSAGQFYSRENAHRNKYQGESLTHSVPLHKDSAFKTDRKDVSRNDLPMHTHKWPTYMVQTMMIRQWGISPSWPQLSFPTHLTKNCLFFHFGG